MLKFKVLMRTWRKDSMTKKWSVLEKAKDITDKYSEKDLIYIFKMDTWTNPRGKEHFIRQISDFRIEEYDVILGN